MPKAKYLQAGDDAFATQLNVFKNNIGGYAAVLGLTAAQTTAQAADANYFTYLLQGQGAMLNGAQQWTSWKKLVRDGGSPPVAGAPVAPTLPTAVAAVALGVEVRFRALVQQIKANTNYNAAMGQALGIEGAQQTAPDLTGVQPQITATINGNRVDVGWGWGGHSNFLDLCEIQVDRNDGHGFGMLAFDTTPGYVDTQPFPTTPVKWTYRAIYRVGDSQVGHWSLSVTVTVGA